MSENQKAFVIMCFDKNLTIVYEKVIKPILEMHHFTCTRADEMTNIGRITEQIEEQIEQSDLIVGDLTYNNPNVFYELGLAHCKKKQIIHITQEPNNIPFDIKHNRMIAYEDTKEGLLDLRDNLSKFIVTLFPGLRETGVPSNLSFRASHKALKEEIEEQRYELLSSVSHKKHYAIKYLGDCKDVESYDTIKRIAGIEKNPDILRDAYVTLYKIDPAKSKTELLNALWQNNYLVRERIVTILGNYEPDKELIGRLKSQLSDSSWGVRRAVCEVFGKWAITDDEELIGKLQSMLTDTEPFVRFSAKEALEKMSFKKK